MHRLAAEPTPADGAGSVDATGARNIGDGGDDLRGHSKAIAPLVPMWYVTNQKPGSVPRPAERILDRAVIRPPGLGCKSCGAPMVRPGRDLLAARSRSTKPMWAAGKPLMRRGATVEDQVDRRDCVRNVRGPGHWPDPNEPRRGCGSRSLIPFVQTTGAWRDRPNRWLVSLQWSGERKAMTTSRDGISASGVPAHSHATSASRGRSA